MSSLRLEGKNGSKGGKATFGRAENLSVWQLTRRRSEQKTKEAKENFEVKIQKDRSTQKNAKQKKHKGKIEMSLFFVFFSLSGLLA